jgi:hypothetical protein
MVWRARLIVTEVTNGRVLLLCFARSPEIASLIGIRPVVITSSVGTICRAFEAINRSAPLPDVVYQAGCLCHMVVERPAAWSFALWVYGLTTAAGRVLRLNSSFILPSSV